MNRFLSVVLTLLFSGQVFAGTLELWSGDRIEGKLVRVEKGNIIWASRHFGELSIKQSKVSNIVTETPLKINGVSAPCLVQEMEAELLVYLCEGDSEPRRVPLASLSVIVPYEHYAAGDFSYRGRLNLSGVYARGNEVRNDWKLNTSTEFRRGDRRHTAMLEYASYSAPETDPDRMWGVRYTLDWFFRERWFWYNAISRGGDERRGIESYATAGTGTGYQFWESQKTALAFTGGWMYVDESYQLPAEPPPDFVESDDRTALRLGVDFRYRLPLGVSLFHKNEWVRSLEESEDWQLTTATGLSTMLADRLYSELKFDYNIDNQPQPERQREDLRLLVGVGYEW